MSQPKREFIGSNTIVEVELTSFGSHVLREYIDAEASRAGHPNPPLEGQRRSTSPREHVEMPLWEVLKVFGPHTVSSVRLSFEQFSFTRPRTSEERMAGEAEREAARARDDLHALAKALGITDDYKAPEQVALAARQFCIAVPSRVPDAPGWWWLGDDVVKVDEVDGHLSARIGGRRKPVSSEQAWRGPAIVDARTPKAGDSDEDMPF